MYPRIPIGKKRRNIRNEESLFITKMKKHRRARTKKGRYKEDDKDTPFFNEAWVKGRSPKKGKGSLQRFLDWFLR